MTAAKEIIRYQSRGFLPRLWIIVAAGLVMIAYGGATDIRFVFAGLIAIFIILPMAVQLAVMKSLASKWSDINLRAGKYVLHHDGVDVFTAETPEAQSVFLVRAAWDEVCRVDDFCGYKVLRFKGGAASCLFLPSDALSESDTVLIEDLRTRLDSMAV